MEKENRQQLEITQRVESQGEALALAQKYLRLHNKYARTASFTMAGDPTLAAGEVIALAGWGGWDGRYIVKQAQHTVGTGDMRPRSPCAGAWSIEERTAWTRTSWKTFWKTWCEWAR